MTGYWPLIIFGLAFVAMFYFFLIRPLRQREKTHDAMVLDLHRGDMVITAGGMYGRVDIIDEDSVVLIVESGAKVRVTKGGILKREGDPEERIGLLS